jgi:D-alanyl-D-alanine carboxypeptidase/D-alanyl-D-alanine-endopeptidase (penicillin-binding protein 4)
MNFLRILPVFLIIVSEFISAKTFSVINLNSNEFVSAGVSISVVNLQTGKVSFEFQPEKLIIPASTMKIVTTATALEKLGPAFQFSTKTGYCGIIEKDGLLKGNLIVVGSGDPTPGSSRLGDTAFLDKWVAAIQKAGIRKIEGNIIADEKSFDDEGVNPKWTWEDIGNYYAPGIYAIAYKDNTLHVSFKTGKAGTPAEITGIHPQIPGLVIENKLMSSTISFDSAWFYGAPKSNFRTVRGKIPMNSNNFVVKADIPDPAALLIVDLKLKLRDAGIEVLEHQTENTSKITEIYTHYSPPLQQLIAETNQKSNNLYAEQIFKSLSLSENAPASNVKSVEIIRNYWKSKGFNVNLLSQVDGSGLSPLNTVSASFMTNLLVYMYEKSQYKNEFIQSLSVSGKTGTLSGMFLNTPLEGKVYGKSGTISKVRCYTGYILTDEKKLAFTFMVNNYQGTSKNMAALFEDFLLKITK